MLDKPPVSELVSRWHELQRQGKAVSLAALCADCPERLPELQAHLRAVANMESFLEVDCEPAGPETKPPEESADAIGQKPSPRPAPSQAITTAQALVDALRRFPVLPPEQLQELIQQAQGQNVDARLLARTLLERACLTPFQVNQLLRGRGHELVLGQYVLVERLGEGGMGQVFKAHHRSLDRIVALKLIRPERLADADAVQRFRREVRLAAQLHHANVVLVFDADQANGVHFMAMEYVAGTDLSELVKEQGPLPIAAACDYVRQAALGLQHAHERGLVHRDIKPSNLLLAPGGVVKILDFGLARLTGVAKPASELTHSGAIMGTPDFIAPEQARDSRDVDIRADLYSLGCTFYYLLTGQAPFQATTLAAKLLQHQMDEPVPVEQVRPEVPPGVAAVVRNLMAKRPEDRYPTPAELAQVLSAGQEQPRPEPVPFAVAVPSKQGQRQLEQPSTLEPKEVAQQQVSRWRLRQRMGVGALVLLAGLIGLGSFLWRGSEAVDKPPATSASGRVAVEVAANQLWQDTGVDVVEGQDVLLVPAGTWQKGQTKSTAKGLESSPRDRTVLPEVPLMCLLVRIGDEATPSPVLKRQVFTAKRSGRLYLQANDLDLEGNSGSLRVGLDGGNSSKERIPAPGPTPVQAADKDLGPLLARAANILAQPDAIRDKVFDFCRKHSGTPQWGRAAKMLRKVPPLTNSIGMKLAPIPPGKFRMGSPENEPGRGEHEGPPHEVEITRPFYMGVYPVTVGDFREFVNRTKYQTEAETSGGGALRRLPNGKFARDPNGSWLNPGFDQTDEYPVVCMSWNDAQKFCEWLSQKEGRRYGLPTEAQWEYSCRAGSSTKYYFGSNDAEAGNYCWHSGNSGWKAHPVGEKKPNAWGLYDMSGNVRNWCQDIHDTDYYKISPKEDPAGPSVGDRRVLRGGNWGDGLSNCRSAYRHGMTPSLYRTTAYGFRVVLVPASLNRGRP